MSSQWGLRFVDDWQLLAPSSPNPCKEVYTWGINTGPYRFLGKTGFLIFGSAREYIL